MTTKLNRNDKRASLLTTLFTLSAIWAFSGSQAQAQNGPGTLDLAGDWTFTTGFSVGIEVVNGYWAPVAASSVYQVHFDLEGPTENGMRYIGYYVGIGGPFGQPGALVAETLYGGVGVQVVQLIEAPVGYNYFRVLSGKHQLYPGFDDERIEVLGGWTETGGSIGNFRLVKNPE